MAAGSTRLAPDRAIRPRAASRGPLLLHAAGRLGRYVRRSGTASRSPGSPTPPSFAPPVPAAAWGPLPAACGSRFAGSWAAVADATLIVARQGTAPQGPDDPAAITATVFRGRLRSSRMLDSQLAVASRPGGGRMLSTCPRLDGRVCPTGSDDGPWHIRVYSIVDLDGVRSISPGLEPTAATVLPGPHPEVTVSYVLKRPWIPGLPWSVSFRTDPPGTAIPPDGTGRPPARGPALGRRRPDRRPLSFGQRRHRLPGPNPL